MSALKSPRQVSRKHELREDTVVTFYARAADYFDKNRAVVYGGLAGLGLIILLIVGYVLYQGQRQERAVDLLGGIVQLYEQGRYRDALDGSEGRPGLLQIADDYGSTNAGNLARFYAADALFRLGEYDEALEYFRKHDPDRSLIGASAIAAQASIYEMRGEYKRAGDLYRRAALHFENELRSPEYLLQAGRAYADAGEFSSAEAAYKLIGERFPESNVAQGIDFHLARLAARRSS